MISYDFMIDNGMFGIDPSIPAVRQSDDEREEVREKVISKGKQDFVKDISFARSHDEKSAVRSKPTVARSREQDVPVMIDDDKNIDKEI